MYWSMTLFLFGFAFQQSESFEAVPTWSEFTQNTTFHGVRYIFESGSYRHRRLVYIVISIPWLPKCFQLSHGTPWCNFFILNDLSDTIVLSNRKMEWLSVSLVMMALPWLCIYVIKDWRFVSSRILWTLIVLGAIAGFLTEVGMRVHVYYQYNTNVDVEVDIILFLIYINSSHHVP